MSEPQDLNTTVFAKTPQGQQEIQSRSLGLAVLVRRILVLVDGKRSGAELAALLPPGTDIAPILNTLMAQACIETVAQASKAAVSAPVPLAKANGAAAPQPAASGLLPAAQRSPKDNDMARHFMINSVNAIIGQNMRISLIHDIFHADSTEKLRTVFYAWEASMSNHGAGARRLPELREKLFKVL